MGSSICSELFSNDSIGTNIYLMTTVTWALILPLQFIENIEVLGPFSAIGIVAVFFAVGVLVFRCTTAKTFGPNVVFVNTKPIALQALPIILNGMFCHLTVVPACAGLRDYWPSLKRPIKTRFRTLVAVSIATMILCAMVYMPASLSGYLLFGDKVEPNVFSNFGNSASGVFVKSDTDVKFSRVCVFLGTALGYPSMLFVARLSIFDALRPKGVKYMSQMYMSVTIGFTVSCLGFALISRLANLDLDFLLALNSSTAGSLIQFMFPGLMLVSLGEKCKGYTLLSFGIGMSIIGIFICISNVICKSVECDFCDVMGMGKSI